MKHNTFLRKLPMIIGALTIILFSLMAAECPSSDDDDDKKAATLSFTLEEDAKKTTATVEKKTDGGVDANGKALVSGKGKTYYTTDAPDGNKFFTLTAKAAKSKGTITYKLKKVGLDDKKKLKIDDAKEVDGKVDKGKVTIKDKKDGFYYLEATVAANGDYKAASAKVLLLVGAVPVPKSVMLDKITPDTSNAPTAGTVTLIDKNTNVQVKGVQDDKEFTVELKIDTKKFPPEAPLYKASLEQKVKSGKGADKLVEEITAGKVKLGDGTGDKNTIVITVEAAAAPPYAAISAYDLYKIKYID